VHPYVADRESLRIGDKIVVVEGARIGKCDRCGHRYWPADVLKRAERAAQDPAQASRMVNVPVVVA
jgi:YgiT-type zinc finger domain-containing protein